MFYFQLSILLLLPAKLFSDGICPNENKTVEAFIDMVLSNLTACAKYVLPLNNAKLIHVEPTEEENIYDFGTFDFVIVGAGSAGSLLANRLTEIEEWNVLLLEAGGQENEFSDIPGMAVNLVLTDMNWGYLSTPQRRACRAMDGQKCMVPKGKVIGGSSTINAKLYSRGNKADYDAWEEMGNAGWSYKDVLSFFTKTENSNIYDGDPGYHGSGGLLDVSYTDSTLLTPIILKGVEELGGKVVDYNGKDQMGVSKMQFTIKGNKIANAGRNFLDPFLNRTNLNITLNAFVTKLLINGANKTAVGVEFIKNGRKYRAKARKEVILSAGAVNTPQILMLSGIGPEEELKRIGIETLVDLPVGKNMEDHIFFVGINFRTNQTLFNQSIEVYLKEYLNNHRPYTAGYSSDVVNFINVSDNKSSVPDIEQLFAVPPGLGPLTLKFFNTAKEYKSLSKPYNDMQVLLALLHPKSQGTVTLKSNNPLDFPIIDYKYFEVEEDIEIIYRGIKETLKLLDTDAFKSINATYSPLMNVCLNHAEGSKEYWYCLIEHLSSSLYHATGTTRMGISRKNSVVTPKLVLHGMRKLRVVDAGVIPMIPSANINAATYMIAEKAADYIKMDYFSCF